MTISPETVEAVRQALVTAGEEMRKAFQKAAEEMQKGLAEARKEAQTRKTAKTTKTVTCMNCGAANLLDSKFCQKCGNPLAGDAWKKRFLPKMEKPKVSLSPNDAAKLARLRADTDAISVDVIARG